MLSHFSFTGAIMSIVIIAIAGILIASMFKRIRKKDKKEPIFGSFLSL
ncbi:hypothetical protein [Bacillus thuringiensis]|nr:hypothetical protein [Bacillus thuringiensis]